LSIGAVSVATQIATGAVSVATQVAGGATSVAGDIKGESLYFSHARFEAHFPEIAFI